MFLFLKACFTTVLCGIEGCAEPTEEVADEWDDDAGMVKATKGGFQEFVAG